MSETNKIACIVTLTALAAYCAASQENPNVGSPFTNRNVVPSANQPRRMISQPNQYASGYDIMTGTVAGGKHFRGVVPYRSDYYGGGAQDSHSLAISDFMRRSVNPIVDDRNPGLYRSYYDPERTVSSLGSRPDGSSGLSRPMISSQGATSYVLPGLPQLANTQFRQRPLSSSPDELDALLTRQTKLRDLTNVKTDRPDKERPKELADFQNLSPQEIEKLLEKDKTTTLERELETKPADATEVEQPPLKPEQDILAEFMKEHTEAILEPKSKDAGQETEEDGASEPPSLPELDDAEALAAEGRRVLGEHATFDSLAEEKTANYLAAAETFLKEGQFYKAADAYALAALWKPQDARVYFGKSLALFGAGEYMSSAYYLTRAFTLDASLAQKPYDLPGIVGSRDTYENRVLEITEWQQRSKSDELAFLLAYVHHLDGKTDKAKAAINTAYETMSDNPAVTLLKNIIDPQPAAP